MEQLQYQILQLQAQKAELLEYCTELEQQVRKIKTELEFERNFLKTIMDSLPVALFVKDAREENFGQFMLWNKASERMFGLTAEQVVGKTDYDFFPKEQADFFYQKDKDAFSRGIPVDIPEEEIDNYNFLQRILHTIKIPLYNKQNQADYILCISEDITARKQAEVALKKSQEQLQLTLNLTCIGTWNFDHKKMEFTADANTLNLLGLGVNNSPIAYVKWCERICPEDRQRVEDAIDCVLTTKTDYEAEYRVVLPNGKTRWLQARGHARCDEVTRHTQILGVLLDITEHKQVEIALQSVVEGTASTTGHDFFPVLVKYISSALDVRHTFVTELVDDELHSLGFWSDGQLQPNISYNPVSTPCQKILEQGAYHCCINIQQLFPNVQRLATLEAESFLGIVLSNDLGEPIGTLCVIDEKPITEPQKFEGILKVFAARASAELQRKRVQEDLQKLNLKLENRVKKRTLKLQESETELSAIFNLAAVGIHLSTLDGRFLKVNQKLCEILGYSQEEILKKTFMDIIYPKDLDKNLNELQKLIAGKIETFYSEQRYIHKNGSSAWINQTVSLIRDVFGKPIYLVGVIEDIRNRKQAEEELKRQLAAVEAAIDGIAIVRGDTYTYLNKAHVEMFGYTHADELIGKTWRDLYKPQEIDFFETNVFPIVLQQKHWRGETTALKKDGTTFDEEVSLTITEQGDLICVCRDISQRKEAERLLEEQSAFLRSIIDNNPNWIFVKDLNGKFLLVNQVMAKFYNATVEELVGKTDAEFHSSPEIERFLKSRRTAINTLQPQMLESSVRKHTGELCYFQITKVPLITSTGEVRSVLGVAMDISDRKKAEEEIRKALAKEKELNDLKSRFISMTSHEFRTPLTVISSSAGILKHFSHKLDEEHKQKHLQCIETYIQHTTQLLDDILLINKAEAGKLAFEPTYINLVSFCETLVEELQLSSPNHTLVFSSHYLKSSSDESGHFSLVCMDKKLLRQILCNLLSNATKYSPESSFVQLNLFIDEKCATFQVKDEGIGIPLEEQPHLFESFFRASNVANIPGTGLGLSIVKKCVEVHEGEITMTSTVGIGTTFTVVLPLKDW